MPAGPAACCCAARRERSPPVSRLGFDPLLALPPHRRFVELLAARSVVIKSLLLDQGFAVGAGDWRADDRLGAGRPALSVPRPAGHISGRPNPPAGSLSFRVAQGESCIDQGMEAGSPGLRFVRQKSPYLPDRVCSGRWFAQVCMGCSIDRKLLTTDLYPHRHSSAVDALAVDRCGGDRQGPIIPVIGASDPLALLRRAAAEQYESRQRMPPRAQRTPGP